MGIPNYLTWNQLEHWHLSFFVLTDDAVWPAAPSCCHLNFPAMVTTRWVNLSPSLLKLLVRIFITATEKETGNLISKVHSTTSYFTNKRLIEWKKGSLIHNFLQNLYNDDKLESPNEIMILLHLNFKLCSRNHLKRYW